MLSKKIIILSLLLTVLWSKPIDLEELNGNWHLRIMDGMEVRKARAILDFDMDSMTLSGFDACNRISGTLKIDTQHTLSSKLRTTRMACRRPIHSYVSKRLHETMHEGFTITESTKNGVDGITLKSQNHELFFGRMGI